MAAPLVQIAGVGERLVVIIASSGLVGLVQDHLRGRLKARGR
jgi:hypothetical protein